MAAEQMVVWVDQIPGFAAERVSGLDFTSPCDGMEREAGYLLPQLLFPVERSAGSSVRWVWAASLWWSAGRSQSRQGHWWRGDW